MQIYTRFQPITVASTNRTGRENASRKNTPNNSAQFALQRTAQSISSKPAWPPVTTVLKKKPRALAVQHANTLNENTEFMRPPGLPLRRIPAALHKGPKKHHKSTPHLASLYTAPSTTLCLLHQEQQLTKQGHNLETISEHNR